MKHHVKPPFKVMGNRMRLFQSALFVVIIGIIMAPSGWAKGGTKEAVVKIFNVYNRYDYDEPWKMQRQKRRSGTGCIISGRRILTNAHVVADQKFIQIKKAGEARKYIAEVAIVAHECDLAILRSTDDSFFSGVRPIEIGSLPEVQDKVAVYGFSEGGDELCITEGVVSRIEHRKYTHSRAYLLTCQIDAAINSGSSGGPVIKDDNVVGVAFQAGSGENIGYMVPAPVINHFLEDIRDGKYDGIPGLGISWQKMENPDLRLRYGMAGHQTGIQVNTVYPHSPARGLLRSGDIILSIDGQNVENDGTIEFRPGERTFFGYPVQNKHMNEQVALRILREKSPMDVVITLTTPMNFGQLVPDERYDEPPTYYIIGGLVFEPLTLNYLKTWKKWYLNAPSNLLNYYFRGEPTEDRREIVVLVKVLADEINVGYHNWKNTVIATVNGRNIAEMRDLVEAFESNTGPYHVMVDELGYRIVLERRKVEENHERILRKYRISSDRSRDLQRPHRP
ncbi:MAG: serine protease [Deltaproteobacteria bacterium]|nr:trypsin-like peptidase domain-containing protein [Deltaproteobacteria bacterium]MBW2310048.1 trypsin-like peptidase domain-containing protein [Deltaproteobacteria bacterium]RLB31316.1 MAG: serine protease [Deltaproteobacteria bacterium]